MATGSIITGDTQLESQLPAAPPVKLARLLPGSAIGRFIVVRHLGEGGWGAVYRARDPRLGREVAIKLKPPGAEAAVTSCRVMCSLLMREGAVMAQLSHPNVLSVYDVGEFRGCIFLAVELVDGGTLRDWAPGHSLAERLRALLDAGRGLAAAHRAGVVHRDFKPENVLVSSEGSVKVADFGRAQVLEWGVGCGGCGADDASAELARGVDDSIAGTLRYMAPQQLDGAIADEPSDQFAFAATAWEVLFDVFPFPATTVSELRTRITAGPTAPPGAAPELIAPLTRALSADPAARYPSIEPLLDALAG